MKKKKEASTIADGDGRKEDDDRISSLPDEILHEILYRLHFHKQCAEAALLSKRWNHIWLSYPVFEFHKYYNPLSKSAVEIFIAAAKRKLYIKSVSIICRYACTANSSVSFYDLCSIVTYTQSSYLYLDETVTLLLLELSWIRFKTENPKRSMWKPVDIWLSQPYYLTPAGSELSSYITARYQKINIQR
ncbi:hypothetical protein LINPERHAP1_LOCUS5338 [Linum perenne]